ncbi:MAG TPA: molecular chaperone DjlA [Alphaproteobacteria bacterium]|nr:molecular chaperone DjlA [Alphaproteobacteria bacterium]
MSIWGKIIGAAAGFIFMGGPIGAILGAIVGHHWWDRAKTNQIKAQETARLKSRSRDDDDDDDDDDDYDDDRRATKRQRKAERERFLAEERAREEARANEWRQRDPHATQEVAFTVGVIALFAKMAKADGLVTRDEIDVFNRVFEVPPSERAHVGQIFDLAKQSIAGFEDYARQVAAIFRGRPGVLVDLLESLFLVAKADNNFHAGEEEFLKRCAALFGITEDHYQRLRESHFGPDQGDPYRILGVDRGAPLEDIKRAYHRAVKENHPDSLIGRGVPSEFVKLATEKLAAINGAYERIKRERGL